MTQISSEPAHNAATLNDEVTLALRAITEKRAATIGYLLDESRQRDIADDSVRESQVYEMDPVSASRAEFIVLFHYCPYVNCWRQQGRGASEIETLCDICMEGDRALTDAFPGLHLEVQTALARGDAACRLRFYQAEEREGEWQP